MAKARRQNDTIDDIATYYQKNREERRHTVQQLEYLITLQLLAKYLRQPVRVLELGAGAGCYTIELAQAGHMVTAVEMVPELVALNSEQLIKAGLDDRVTLITADARALDQETAGPFDVILAMGPLYHLVLLKDRVDLMSKMVNRLKPGGLILSAHLSRMGLMGYMLTRHPAWAAESPKQIQQIRSIGHLPDHPRNGQFRGYFTTIEEIQDLHVSQGLEILKIHCQDPAIGSVDEIFNRLPADLKVTWVEILTQMSADPMAWGSGRSLLCVARKPE